jgi:hypothetical protein
VNATSDTLAASGRAVLESARPAEAPARADVLLGVQGRPANDIWTKAEWTNLCRHLNNENGDFRFIMGTRKHGIKLYWRSKRLPLEKAIYWGWDSICGKSKTRAAFTPYSKNNRQQSRWGAMDWDAHNGEEQRAWGFALHAFRLLVTMNSDLFIVLEHSGSGLHLWAIAKEFKPVGWWVRLLKKIAAAIGAPIRDGVCEIYPSDNLPERSPFGVGMRAPGSWNPGTEKANNIFWQNLHDLLAAIDQNACSDPSARLTNQQKKFLLRPEGPIPKRSREGPRGAGKAGRKMNLYRWDEWREKFAITTPATRNNQLKELVGEVFWQVGSWMARRMAEEQFTSKVVQTVANLESHMASFEALWRGMNRTWLKTLSKAERERYDRLETQNLRDAFRIVRSYRRKADIDDSAEFAIAAENLGNRLGITTQGACDIRKELQRAGVVRKTREYQPHVSAAYYCWTSGEAVPA